MKKSKIQRGQQTWSICVILEGTPVFISLNFKETHKSQNLHLNLSRRRHGLTGTTI